MANDDQPGYSGADLIHAANQAANRDDSLRPRISELVQSLADQDGADASDARVRELVGLIEQTGVTVPLRPRKP